MLCFTRWTRGQPLSKPQLIPIASYLTSRSWRVSPALKVSAVNTTYASKPKAYLEMNALGLQSPCNVQLGAFLYINMSQMSEQNYMFVSYIIPYFVFIFINSIMYFFSLKGGCHISDKFCLRGSLLIIYLYTYHVYFIYFWIK